MIWLKALSLKCNISQQYDYFCEKVHWKVLNIRFDYLNLLIWIFFDKKERMTPDWSGFSKYQFLNKMFHLDYCVPTKWISAVVSPWLRKKRKQLEINPCRALLKNSRLLKSALESPGAYNLGYLSAWSTSTSWSKMPMAKTGWEL